MSTVVFILSVAGFVVVVFWTRANDRAGAAGGRTGLLRMRGVGEEEGDRSASARPWTGADRRPASTRTYVMGAERRRWRGGPDRWRRGS